MVPQLTWQRVQGSVIINNDKIRIRSVTREPSLDVACLVAVRSVVGTELIETVDVEPSGFKYLFPLIY